LAAAAVEALTASEARKLWTWCIDPASANRADASVGMDVSGTCSCPPITTACCGGDRGGLAVVVVVVTVPAVAIIIVPLWAVCGSGLSSSVVV
jgi:hypothetical protein